MLCKAMLFLAIVIGLVDFGLSTSAFARSGGHGGGGRGDSFRIPHFAGGFGGVREANGIAGSHSGLRGYGSRDVWGHWGTYYGPMIPAI